MTTGEGCHLFAYQSKSHELLNKRKMLNARILHILFSEDLRKKYPAKSNINIQLKGDNKSDNTDEANWCILLWIYNVRDFDENVSKKQEKQFFSEGKFYLFFEIEQYTPIYIHLYRVAYL